VSIVLSGKNKSSIKAKSKTDPKLWQSIKGKMRNGKEEDKNAGWTKDITQVT